MRKLRTNSLLFLKKGLLIAGLFLSFQSFSQTPGLIVKPAADIGASVLDPDGNGYVSESSTGFVSNDFDFDESEIDYVDIVRPDPVGDPLAGPDGSFNEIVGATGAGDHAILGYLSGANVLFRFRLDDIASNSKAYSILIDTDQKFGFTGEDADPNAVLGNPGFEIEVALYTNFRVVVCNIDGNADARNNIVNETGNYPGYSFARPYEVYCQKSVAYSTNSGDADFFYDFFVPFSDLQLAYPSLTTSTPLRITGATSMNPHASIGNNAISDLGGDSSGSKDINALFESVITSQTPTAIGSTILDRTDCPTINAAGTSDTNISGTTTTETTTTIAVTIYDTDATTVIGTASTVVSAGISTWSIDISEFSPSIASLLSGYIIKANATDEGKGTSVDYCDIETVSDCSTQTSTSGMTITAISGGKGFTFDGDAGAFSDGTVITWYNADYTLADYEYSSGVPIPNPTTTTYIAGTGNNKEDAKFECKTGQCFPAGVYYFTYQQPGECVSDYVQVCLYALTGTSVTPTITTSPILTSTTAISGTCGNSASPDYTRLNLYLNEQLIGTQSVSDNSTWTFSGLDLTDHVGEEIYVSASDAEKCAASSSTISVQRQAIAPSIDFDGCSTSTTVSSISGSSVEAAGTTIILYRLSPTRSSIGTTTVATDGSWSISGLSLSAGDQITAVASSTTLASSDDSETITISLQTDITNYTITFNTPTEGDLQLTGTITGGSYPLTLRVYLDESQIGADTTITSDAGPTDWHVSYLNSFDLSAGGIVQISVEISSACESELSAETAIVACSDVETKTISSADTNLCEGENGSVTIENSEAGVIYTPLDQTGLISLGYSVLGNGSDIDLLTFPLLTDSTVVKIETSKIPFDLCTGSLADSIIFRVFELPDAPTSSATQKYCPSGTTTLDELVITLPANTLLRWYDSASGGTVLAGSTVLADGTNYYAESESTTSGCISASRTVVNVEAGNPDAPDAVASQTFCEGATLADINVSPVGPGTVSWFTGSSGGSALAETTPLADGTTYYAETNHYSCSSDSRTAVLITLNTVSAGTIAANQSVKVGADPAELTETVAAATAGTTSYQWQISTTDASTGFADISSANASTYTPPSGIAQTSYFKRVVTSTLDGLECSAESNVITITVSPNTAPVAVSDTYTMDEDGTAISLNPKNGDSDVDGDLLSIVSINGTALTGGAQTIDTPNGTITIDASDAISFSPDANYNGTETFAYVISDGTTTATANQEITVNAVNDDPVAASVTYTMNEDGTAISLNPKNGD
ncbi:Ig-like domain-containing protein, partial [Mangrovibacterium sp.]|uniref:Ig-like domain-containing protein n=1 Tax=Mangrovibacterium sp. TaxID=1961364 RepID=UPI003565510E